MTVTEERKPPSNVGITSDFIFEGGAEAVLDVLCDAFPDSTLYTAIYDPETLPRYPNINRTLEQGRLRTSAAQAILRVPGLIRRLSLYHFYWLYFLTSAVQKTTRHEAVIVSSSAQSKLIRIPQGARVVVYFHTPTRWLYPRLITAGDLQAIPRPLRALMRVLELGLRPLDKLGVQRLKRHRPVFLCNSSYVQKSLAEIYGLEASVLHPPVETDRFAGLDRQAEDFFLCHGRLSFQKRIDVGIRACLMARKRLVISGQPVSPEVQTHLQSIVTRAVARDPSLDGLIEFRGRTEAAEFMDLLSRCAALIFPPREDFGIAPTEAIAGGVPVIAYRAGGALDYIRPGVNGAFFDEQTPESLAPVLATFDPAEFDAAAVASSLPDLSVARFQDAIRSAVNGT